MNYRIWSGRAAICFAPTIVAQVVARNWGGWEWWPFWIDDIIAAILLIVGGYMALDNDTTTNSRLLTGAWFFTAATSWMSMFTLLATPAIADPIPIWLTTLSVVSTLGAIVGGIASLPSKRLVPGRGAPKAAPRPTPKRRSRSKSKSE